MLTTVSGMVAVKLRQVSLYLVIVLRLAHFVYILVICWYIQIP